jgi:hypothetical protein
VTYALDKKAVHRVQCFDRLVDLSVEIKANHIRFLKKEDKYECEGTWLIAVTDNGGDDIEHVECGQHHAALAEGPSIDELLANMANHNGISSERFNRS